MLRPLLLMIVCGLGCTNQPTDSDTAAAPEAIRILAWNIESGGSDPRQILQELRSSAMPKCDILALCEVPEEEAINFAYESWGRYNGNWGMTGGDDRLMLAWSPRFDLVRIDEILDMPEMETIPDQRDPAPLYVRLRELQTGREFIVMNNQMDSDDSRVRVQQARLLCAWAKKQTLPIIAVGNFHMGYSLETDIGDDAFALMLEDATYRWIRPQEMVDTHWSDSNGDGHDDDPSALQDFAFVAGPSIGWDIITQVITREGDFPDSSSTSDHRPLLTTIRSY